MQAEEKFEKQIRSIEMKKGLEIETEKEKALSEVIEARHKLKLAEPDLQLGQNSINRFKKIEVYTKTKPVAANKPSSIPTYSKLPTVPLKTPIQTKTPYIIFCILLQNLKQ